MKYRKKPVIIDAFQYDGDLIDKNGNYYVPDWAVEANENGILYFDSFNGSAPFELFIKTLEGPLHVSVNSYVIRGVHGELYACDPDIFKETYEEVKQC